MTARRIIPARAGFTNSTEKVDKNFKDHPRSRGVYRGDDALRAPAEGSSPLARGLLARLYRAWAAETDHPRSRGVYRADAPAIAPGLGSSPLARGLPSTMGGTRPCTGIIPARAGFTNPLSRDPEHS